MTIEKNIIDGAAGDHIHQHNEAEGNEALDGPAVISAADIAQNAAEGVIIEAVGLQAEAHADLYEPLHLPIPKISSFIASYYSCLSEKLILTTHLELSNDVTEIIQSTCDDGAMLTTIVGKTIAEEYSNELDFSHIGELRELTPADQIIANELEAIVQSFSSDIQPITTALQDQLTLFPHPACKTRGLLNDTIGHLGNLQVCAMTLQAVLSENTVKKYCPAQMIISFLNRMEIHAASQAPIQ